MLILNQHHINHFLQTAHTFLLLQPFYLYQDFIQDFLDKAVTFRNPFPNGEERLLQASTDFFDEYGYGISLWLSPYLFLYTNAVDKILSYHEILVYEWYPIFFQDRHLVFNFLVSSASVALLMILVFWLVSL